MKVNAAGLALIEHFEGLKLTAYLDPVSIWTIGWGHTGPDVFQGLRIGLQEAERLLAEDLEEPEEFVAQAVTTAISADAFSALVSFAFNVGNGNLKSSTLLKKLNNADHVGAADEFLRWVKGAVNGRKVTLPGLVRRREQERSLFLSQPTILGAERMTITAASAATTFSAPGVLATDDYDDDFESFIQSLGLRYFKPYEFRVMGHQHTNPNSAAFGLNTPPPRNLWANISATAQVLDRLRGVVGAPIATISVYRSPAYNKKIAGATGSQHLQFNAIDFIVKSNSSPADWANALRQMRQAGVFQGGIGTYASFVHIDTRGTNADW